MNKKLFILTTVLLKNSISLSPDNKKKMRQIILILVIAISCVPMAISIVKFMSGMYDGLAQLGEQGALLSLGIALSAFVIFFFGLFYLMNTFYFSNDIENLLPLPFQSSQILGAKFITVTLYEYLTEALILLPVLIVFGIKSGGGFLYYLYALLIFLFLPVIPIVVASMVVMIIMRFTNIAKNKDRFRVISAIIAIFFGVGVSTLTQKLTLSQGVEQIVPGNNALVDMTSRIYPVAKLGAYGLMKSESVQGLAYIGVFVLLSILGFYLFLPLANLLYYKGVTGVSVSTSRKKKLSVQELNRQAIRSPILKTYVLKEIRILFRTPAYFINCVLMNFLGPVLLAIPIITQPKTKMGLSQIASLLQDSEKSGLILSIAFGIILFTASGNGIACTSISREGENFFVNKFIPLGFKTQIMAKVLSGIIMGVFGMLSLVIAAVVFFKIPLDLLVLLVVSGLLGILFSNLSGIIIDLFNPKLHWDNEQKAVKQNMNVLFCMALSAGTGGGCIYLIYSLKLGLMQAFAGLVAVYGIADILLYLFLSMKGSEMFRKIEY